MNVQQSERFAQPPVDSISSNSNNNNSDEHVYGHGAYRTVPLSQRTGELGQVQATKVRLNNEASPAAAPEASPAGSSKPAAAPEALPAPGPEASPGQINIRQLATLESRLAGINVFSASVEALGIGHLAREEIDGTKLAAAWNKTYQGFPPRTALSIFMDCRCLYDGPRGCEDHPGEHFSSVEILSEHPGLRPWLASFMSQYLCCLNFDRVHGGDAMKIVCLCEDGEYTSVTCARMFYCLLGARFKYTGIQHMEAQKWCCKCKCDGTCSDCNSKPGSTRKMYAFKKCENVWRSLFKPR